MTDRSYICVEMTKAEKTRQLIIEQAAPIFNTKGLAGTSMSDIMAATKLAKGSLYVHFEDKDDLAFHVVEHNVNLLMRKTLGAMDSPKSAKDKLFAYLDVISDPLHPPVPGGCPILNFGTEVDDANPAIQKKLDKVVKQVQQAIAKVVDEGISKGEFDGSWNSREFAVKMFALMEGAILVTRVTGKYDQMKLIVKMLKEEINAYTK